MVEVHGGTLFWSVITFILLLVILKKVAWVPIIEALENREVEIKEALSSAQEARENAAIEKQNQFIETRKQKIARKDF